MFDSKVNYQCDISNNNITEEIVSKHLSYMASRLVGM